MSRRIERFGRTGFITKADGKCWLVHVNEDGTRGNTQRVQDGFPFYSPNCRRQDSYIGNVGGDSWPTERAGWEIIEASPGVDQFGRNQAYIIRDRLYSRDYWIATLEDGSRYSAVNVGPERPGSFEGNELERPEGNGGKLDVSPIRHLIQTTDYAKLALYTLGAIGTFALIYFGTKTILKRL